MTLIDEAQRWRAAGFTCLPAAADGSKTPAVPTWRQWQHTPPTPAEYAAMPTTGGIGLLCGATSGNLEMLEVEGAAADLLPDILAAMADHGCADLWHRIVSGYSEQTPGGGVHWLYRVDGPARPNTKLARAPKPGGGVQVLIETRGQGGWTIIAPSNGTTHPTGKAWTKISGGPEAVAVISEDERDLIHAILQLFDRTPPADTQPPPAPGQTGGTRPGDDFNARADWADILVGWTRVRRMGKGYAWRRPGKNEGISATTGQSDDGADRLFVFTTSTVLPAETPLSKFGAYAHLQHGGDYRAAARALKAQGYGQAVVDDGPDLADMFEQPNTTDDNDGADPDDPHAATRRTFPRLDWHELWNDDSEEEWVLEPLLPARRLVALYSAPKVGKSLLMLEMAVGISRGAVTLGYQVPRAYSVLYVDFENDPKGDVRSRLQAMGYGPDDLTNLHYLSFPTMAALDSIEGGRQLLAAVAAYGCEIVVIDTVSRAVSGDENENDTWLAFYRHTGLLLKQAQVALIRLDHSGKDETKGQRGGSAKSGDVDAIWRMSKLNDTTFELICDASRIHITEKHLTIHRENNPRLHHRVNAAGQAAAFAIAVNDLIAWLDSNDLPDEATNKQVREFMAKHHKKAAKAISEAAVRKRQNRGSGEDFWDD